MDDAFAIETLFRAAHGEFVTERKRLALELKASGNKASAARLLKLERPSISAWAVNQLWWREREGFEALFAAAERLRKGQLEASAERRELLADLRARAAKLLSDAGHASNEATLRRVAGTLAALGASGSFDPDPPGALCRDRDPPGFGALEGAVFPAPAASEARKPVAPSRDEAAAARRAAEERAAEKKRLEGALRSARVALEGKNEEVERLLRRLAEAKKDADEATLEVERLSVAIAELG
jgi:hypothetical protein